MVKDNLNSELVN